MKTLHIVNTANEDAIAHILSLVTHEDSLLLIGNGVYASIQQAVLTLAEKQAVYVMEDDLQSRGLQQRCANTFTRCDYARFVNLCCDHENSVSW